MFIVKGQSQKRDSLKKSAMYLFADMVVYNKKKIQMLFVEYGFYFTREYGFYFTLEV